MSNSTMLTTVILMRYRRWMMDKQIDFHFKWFGERGCYGGWMEGSTMPVIYADSTEQIMRLFFHSVKGKKINVNRGSNITEELTIPNFFYEDDDANHKPRKAEAQGDREVEVPDRQA